MTALAAPSTRNPLALGAIRFYQKWISPYKGFKCAHNVLHGEGSCSHFGYEAFSNHSAWEALGLLHGRFKECRAAYETLIVAQVGEGRKSRSRQTNIGSGNSKRNSAADCVPDPCMTLLVFDACTPGPALPCEMAACDASACDVSACDIGACG